MKKKTETKVEVVPQETPEVAPVDTVRLNDELVRTKAYGYDVDAEINKFNAEITRLSNIRQQVDVRVQELITQLQG